MKLDCLDHSVFFSDDTAMLQQLITNLKPSKLAVLLDEQTEKVCLPLVTPLIDAIVIKIPCGEQHKTLETCVFIWEQLTKHEFDRHGLLVNLGGGVITDIGGFVAATYKRGIKFINIPTTLLAMIDASVGGKTGVDFQGFKNHIGLFSNPEGVWVNPTFLKTLSDRQVRSGMAEMLKHALIDPDTAHWASLKNNFDPVNLELIFKSVSVKHTIVTKDPKEQNIRKFLNYGHTLGHAIETYFLYKAIPEDQKLLHGEAVAMGMVMETFLSCKLCGLDKIILNEVTNIVQALFSLPKIHKDEIPKILKLLVQDKKNKNKAINFVLLEGLGMPVLDVNTISESLIEAAIAYCNTLGS